MGMKALLTKANHIPGAEAWKYPTSKNRCDDMGLKRLITGHGKVQSFGSSVEVGC
jgi:hypothetical protein